MCPAPGDRLHSPTPSTQAGLLGTPGRNRLRARGRSLRAPPDGMSCLLEGQPVSQFQSSESRGTEGTGEMTAACAGAQGLTSGAQHPGAGGPGPSAGRSRSWLEKGGVAPGGRLGRQGKQDRRTEPGLALPTCGSPLEGTCGTCSPRRAMAESPEAPGGNPQPHPPWGGPASLKWGAQLSLLQPPGLPRGAGRAGCGPNCSPPAHCPRFHQGSGPWTRTHSS